MNITAFEYGDSIVVVDCGLSFPEDDMLGIDLEPSVLMRELSVSEMQMVEIAKALSYGARIIIMDEPTSAITEAEVEKLFQNIKMLKEQGTGIIYISHKMDK